MPENKLQPQIPAEEAANGEKLSQEQVSKSLDYSIKDGSFYSAMLGFGENYLTAFALRLGASNAEIALLAALPQAASSIAQQVAARVTEKIGKRKEIIVNYALLQGLFWIPIILTPFLFPQTPVPFLIIFVCAYMSFLGFSALPWASLMGDIVPRETRGAYFGKRNEILGFTALATSMIAGAILGWFDNANTNHLTNSINLLGTQMPSWLAGFTLIFFLAFTARMVSVAYLAKMNDPPYTRPTAAQHQLSLGEFFSQLRKTDFGTFTAYSALTQFAVNLSGPFFIVYVLEELKFDYLTFSIWMAAAMFTQFISMPYWGKLADKYGNKTTLTAAGLLLPFIPIAFTLSNNTAYWIFIHAISGFIWAGFTLITFNYMLDATQPSTRPRFVANYNFTNNTAILTGAILGGGLATFFAGKSILFLHGLLILFTVSGLLRLLIAAYFLPKIKETTTPPTPVENQREFIFNAIAIYPALGIMRRLEDAAHFATSSAKKIRQKIKAKK